MLSVLPNLWQHDWLLTDQQSWDVQSLKHESRAQVDQCMDVELTR